jgi:hypothetical protein
MRRASLTAFVTAALYGLASPAPLAAEERVEAPSGTATPEEPAGADAPSDGAARATRPGSTAATRPRGNLPENAVAALVRAAAAYEYGDLYQVVEAARPVTEGLLPASPDVQAQAFRLLGIGLYLTNRPQGAETAFTELLRLEPRARLDPTTTRPELVAFFESLRRQNLVRQRSARRLVWNFIPPVGQFQNGDNAKGVIVLGVGVASLAALASSYFVLKSWERNPGHTYPGHENSASTLKTANWVSAGVLAVAYIYGVFDGLVGYSKPLDDDKPSVAFKLSPQGAGLGFAF